MPSSHGLEQEYLGGLGVNTRLLADRVPPGADPLGPENLLLFGVGPLVGMMLPTACRTEVTAKSPLSGRFGTANGGGSFGPALRYAGISYLAFSGKAKEPMMLIIDDGEIMLENAADLWGQDVWEATDAIRARLGEEFHVAVIGPAGENQVRFASIQNDYFASWGRTGMGAVMGSKRLKAVAVRGNGGLSPADKNKFSSIRKEAFSRVKDEPSFGFMKRYGSMVVSDPFDATGALPGRNFKIGSYANWEETRGRKFFEKRYKEADVACFSCPIACAHWSRVKEDGPHSGLETRGLEVLSEHKKASLHGQLGFSNLRGREENSFEKQLARQVKSKITYNSKRPYEKLQEEYTHVVVATGDGGYAEKLHNYDTDLTVTLKGATVEGTFDRYTVAAWLDNRYAPKGYCYFIPLSEHEANLVIAFPDYPEIRELDRQALWEAFFLRAGDDLGQELRITDNFEITGYKIGICKAPRIGNTFFTGNCFGAIMPFLGFGQYPAILTGIYSALDLCGRGHYQDLTQHLRKSYHNALVLRRGLEKLSNSNLDRLVASLQTSAAERLFNTRYDFLKAASWLLRPFT